ncbi:MAG TPA: hypothetical protein PKM59_12225 [Thermodesulfobacteriota bacterium]|nr:hypothetical protein [Thermodesulfobacteriota bacterium]HNU70847.1 hypothetical protein [Thermodesulfobacteriota bacterium]
MTFPAKGTKPYYNDLYNFLAVSLNMTTGELKAGSTVATQWKNTGYTASKVSADTFRVTNPASDLTVQFILGRRVLINAGASPVYGTVKSATYSGSYTDVTLFRENVPEGTFSQLDISIVAPGPYGSTMPIFPVTTLPAIYSHLYACCIVIDLSTGLTWYGNPIWEAFIPLGGSMIYKDWTKSAIKGGSAVTVGAGAAVTTRLDFNTPVTLNGFLTSLVVAGKNRASNGCENFDVYVYTKTPTGTWGTDSEFCVYQLKGLYAIMEPYGYLDHNLRLTIHNEDVTYADSLWVEIVNQDGASADFDIEATVELAFTV